MTGKGLLFFAVFLFFAVRVVMNIRKIAIV